MAQALSQLISSTFIPRDATTTRSARNETVAEAESFAGAPLEGDSDTEEESDFCDNEDIVHAQEVVEGRQRQLELESENAMDATGCLVVLRLHCNLYFRDTLHG